MLVTRRSLDIFRNLEFLAGWFFLQAARVLVGSLGVGSGRCVVSHVHLPGVSICLQVALIRTLETVLHHKTF